MRTCVYRNFAPAGVLVFPLWSKQLKGQPCEAHAYWIHSCTVKELYERLPFIVCTYSMLFDSPERINMIGALTPWRFLRLYAGFEAMQRRIFWCKRHVYIYEDAYILQKMRIFIQINMPFWCKIACLSVGMKMSIIYWKCPSSYK